MNWPGIRKNVQMEFITKNIEWTLLNKTLKSNPIGTSFLNNFNTKNFFIVYQEQQRMQRRLKNWRKI